MGSLTKEQVAQFEEEGYLVVRGLFDPAQDLHPIIDEYKGVLDTLAGELYAKGEISSLHDDLPFGERLISVYQESGKVHAQYFDFSLPQADVKPDTPFWAGPAVFAAMLNEKLLDAVESLIGPEIYSNPVQHVRMKPPEHLTPKNEQGQVQLGKSPVHQDNGVVTPDADETQMLTVWFPLTRATVKHGCLVVWPGSHRKGLLDHCPTDIGLGIPGKLLGGSKAMPMPMEPVRPRTIMLRSPAHARRSAAHPHPAAQGQTGPGTTALPDRSAWRGRPPRSGLAPGRPSGRGSSGGGRSCPSGRFPSRAPTGRGPVEHSMH